MVVFSCVYIKRDLGKRLVYMKRVSSHLRCVNALVQTRSTCGAARGRCDTSIKSNLGKRLLYMKRARS